MFDMLGALVGFADYSQVDILGEWYKFVNCGAVKSRPHQIGGPGKSLTNLVRGGGVRVRSRTLCACASMRFA